MVLGAFRDGLYNLFLALHLVSVVAAFAPAVIHPLLIARTRPDGDTALGRLAGAMVANSRVVHIPALVLTAPFGIAMVLLSDDVWEMGDPWISASFLVWIALCGIVTGVILPGERALAAGDASAERKVAFGGQLATLGFVIMLWLMIWKPGA